MNMLLAVVAVAWSSSLAGQTAEPLPLVGPTWVVVELGGTPVPLTPAERQPMLQFVAGGHIAGSDGCNRLRATYRLRGDQLTFGPLAVTRMACPGLEPLTARFEAALKRAARWRLASDRLQLFGTDDVLLVAFEARRGGATAGEEPPPARPGPPAPPAAATAPPAVAAPLASKVFDWASLTPVTIPNGERRMVLDGPTATVDLLHVHVTTLAPGKVSGPPVRHLQEEVLIVKEGEVEVSLDGTIQKAGPGAVLFFAAGAVTGLRNTGTVPATYYVIYYKTPRTPKA
jgi:XRE family transcriptional regulator, regulator of sulfur utilization